MTVKSGITRSALLAAILALVAAMAIVSAAPSEERTLEELKAEAQARADRNGYPLEGLRPDEVREALSRLKSLDRDEWAASWSMLGDRYMTKAQGELSSSPAQADKDFVQAWLLLQLRSLAGAELTRQAEGL